MVAEVVGGRFELGRCLGRGARSSVWLARDRELGREVAVKILEDDGGDPEAAARFREEARTVARLSHPNILRVYGRGVSAGREFVVFEYAGTSTLRTLLDERGPLPAREAAELALGPARAVAFAARHGLCRRTLRARTVLLGPGGVPKLPYWGFAPAQEARDGDACSTLGLARLVYELLAGAEPGREPGGGPAPLAALRPDCPPELAALVDRALAAGDPRALPAPAAFAAALERSLDELDPAPAEPDPAPAPTAVLPGPATPPPPRARRRLEPGLVALAAGLALLAAVAALLLTRHPHRPSPAQSTEAALKADLLAQVRRRSPRVVLHALRCAVSPQGTRATCRATGTLPGGRRRAYTIRAVLSANGILAYHVGWVAVPASPPNGHGPRPRRR